MPSWGANLNILPKVLWAKYTTDPTCTADSGLLSHPALPLITDSCPKGLLEATTVSAPDTSENRVLEKLPLHIQGKATPTLEK